MLFDCGVQYAGHCAIADIATRRGGEEFVVLTSEAEKAAAQTAEHLRHFEVSPVEAGGLRMRLTTSIGVATSEPLPHDIDVLMARRSSALRRQVWRPESRRGGQRTLRSAAG